jgi:hypothetical protein
VVAFYKILVHLKKFHPVTLTIAFLAPFVISFNDFLVPLFTFIQIIQISILPTLIRSINLVLHFFHPL